MVTGGSVSGDSVSGGSRSGGSRSGAWAVAAGVADPELPMVTVADLGILRDVHADADGGVVVTITPTYSGCPAMREIAAGLRGRLLAAGYRSVTVRTALAPAWTSDWITARGRRKLAAAGIAPPGPANRNPQPVPLTLSPRPVTVACPRCGSPRTRETSAFGPAACLSLRVCEACLEPFEHVKRRE